MFNRLLLPFASAWLAAVAGVAASGAAPWSAAQLRELQSMSIRELGPPPADASNRFAEDQRAARLGERLFQDPRLSSNGRVSCGTCHQAARDFQDGTPLAVGVGTTTRRSMPIAATAHSPFLFWDGRKDSQWAQALGPLESPVEHGGTRALYAHVIATFYRHDYEEIFGAMPDLSGIPQVAGPVDDHAAAAAWAGLGEIQQRDVTGVFVNIGKAIAAYERRIQLTASRFDRYVDAISDNQSTVGTLTDEEVNGLRLFTGKANCTQCHNGPLLTNNEFHNTGVPARAGLPPDTGRVDGATRVLRDEFNCRSRWSDAPKSSCIELDVLMVDAHTQQRAFKVPSLRNVANRAPYMHAGQFATLDAVLDHYNRAPVAPSGHTELKPLRLNPRELRELKAFLESLSAHDSASGADGAEGVSRVPRG